MFTISPQSFLPFPDSQITYSFSSYNASPVSRKQSDSSLSLTEKWRSLLNSWLETSLSPYLYLREYANSLGEPSRLPTSQSPPLSSYAPWILEQIILLLVGSLVPCSVHHSDPHASAVTCADPRCVPESFLNLKLTGKSSTHRFIPWHRIGLNSPRWSGHLPKRWWPCDTFIDWYTGPGWFSRHQKYSRDSSHR